MFQKQLDPSIFIYKRRKIFKTLHQRRLAEKKRMTPHVYSRVYCKVTFIALLILIGLSALLRYHRNHDESFINSGDKCCVEFMSADRARESAPNVRPKHIDQLHVPNDIFPWMALSACSSRGRLRTSAPVLSIFRRHEWKQRTILITCIRCF